MLDIDFEKFRNAGCRPAVKELLYIWRSIRAEAHVQIGGAVYDLILSRDFKDVTSVSKDEG
jgi:hypothetical protein